MKRSVCKKCNRGYWAQATGVVRKEGVVVRHSEPRTQLCKKHSPPTKKHLKKERLTEWKRHRTKRGEKGIAAKKQKERKDDA